MATEALHPSDAVYTQSYDGKRRKDKRSPLKKALDRMDPTEHYLIEACPYGCKAADQDAHGLCKHVIGFCLHASLPDGPVTKLPPDPVSVETVAKEPDKTFNRRPVKGRDVLRVGDHLVRIVNTLRVYRKEPDPPAETKKPDPKVPVG